MAGVGTGLFTQVVRSLVDGGNAVSAIFADVGSWGPILSAGIAVHLIRSLLSALNDDDLGEFAEEMVNLGIMATILMTAITNHAWIESTVWETAGELMGVMAAAGGSPAGGSGSDIAVSVVNNVTTNATKVFVDIWDLLIATREPTGDEGVMEVIAAIGENLLAAGLALIALIMALVYVAIMALQVTTGILMVVIGLMFLPLMLALYPLIENWLKNAIGLIAAGIAHLGIVSFLTAVISKVASDMTANFQAQRYEDIFQASMNGDDLFLGMKMLMMLVLCVFLLVLAFASSKAVTMATTLFGQPSGMIGKLGRKKGGAGGGGDAGSAASSASSTGAGAAAGGPAGGAAAGGAAGGAAAGGGAGTVGSAATSIATGGAGVAITAAQVTAAAALGGTPAISGFGGAGGSSGEKGGGSSGSDSGADAGGGASGGSTGGPGGGTSLSTGGGQAGDGVIDAEFSEVKDGQLPGPSGGGALPGPTGGGTLPPP